MFGVNDVAMMLCAGNFRVALLTEHIPVAEVAAQITKEKIVSKLQVIHQSLQRDFGIDRPRIAVLGLNPHAGDEGLIGSEEENIIKPDAVQQPRIIFFEHFFIQMLPLPWHKIKMACS